MKFEPGSLKIPSELLEIERINSSRLGWIVSVDSDGKVLVNFEENPFQSAIQAKLSRPFMRDDLTHASQQALEVKLEFENGDPRFPIIRDIFYSILNKTNKKQEQPDNKNREIHLKGKRIVIEGETEIVIKSGKASTTWLAKEGKLVERAERVRSTAKINQRIEGGTVSIN